MEVTKPNDFIGFGISLARSTYPNRENPGRASRSGHISLVHGVSPPIDGWVPRVAVGLLPVLDTIGILVRCRPGPARPRPVRARPGRAPICSRNPARGCTFAWFNNFIIFKDWQSVILGVWVAPGASVTRQKDGGRRPPPF
jgi:hypothetical protein